MSTQESIAEFLAEQVADAGVIRIRKMFGEYGMYCNDKIVALICDDQFFVKPTEQARAFIGEPEEAPPYPGSKPFFFIDEGKWDDRTWMSELIRITEEALPMPKPKKPKKKK